MIKAGVLQLKLEQKVSENMTTLLVGSNEFPAKVIPTLLGKIMLLNYDSRNLRQKGLPPVSTKNREIMWVHPYLLDKKQWSLPNF